MPVMFAGSMTNGECVVMCVFLIVTGFIVWVINK
jgi:hypothetical protein